MKKTVFKSIVWVLIIALQFSSLTFTTFASSDEDEYNRVVEKFAWLTVEEKIAQIEQWKAQLAEAQKKIDSLEHNPEYENGKRVYKIETGISAVLFGTGFLGGIITLGCLFVSSGGSSGMPDYNIPGVDTTAKIGVGMFLVGVVFGTIFALKGAYDKNHTLKLTEDQLAQLQSELDTLNKYLTNLGGLYYELSEVSDN